MGWPFLKGGATSTTGQIAQNIQGYYDRLLLRVAQPKLIWHLFAQVRTLPEGEGTRINFRRYGELAANTTPLTQGVTPAGTQITVTDIYAEVSFYGDYTVLTDEVMLTIKDRVLNETTKLLGRQAAKSLDLIWRSVFVAGTNVLYATSAGAADTDVNTVVGDLDFALAEETLDDVDAEEIAEKVSAGPNVGTEPVDGGYYAIMHSDMKYDISNLAEFIPVKSYASQKGLKEGEFGAVGRIRCLATTQGYKAAGGGASSVGTTVKATSSAADVYYIVIFAANGAGIVPLGAQGQGKPANFQTIIQPLGSAGAADPLKQRASVGWKAATSAKILNDDYILRIVTACSDKAALKAA